MWRASENPRPVHPRRDARREAFHNRGRFYGAALYLESAEAGQGYGSLRRSIVILILDFEMWAGDDFQHRFLLRDEEHGLVWPGSSELRTFEIRKAGRIPSTLLEAWIRFFGIVTREEGMELAARHPLFEEALRELERLSLNAADRALAAAREKNLRDYFDDLEEARAKRERALAEREARGRAEEKEENAVNLLKAGVPAETISQCLGLSPERLREIAAGIR